MWVEQNYKQVKHAMGWSQYQVRSDQAIRRHWQLVWCAFSFCWYHASYPSASATQEAKAPSEPEAPLHIGIPADATGTREKNQRGKRRAATSILAADVAGSPRMVGALDHAAALLERLVATAPTSCVAGAAPMALAPAGDRTLQIRLTLLHKLPLERRYERLDPGCVNVGRPFLSSKVD